MAARKVPAATSAHRITLPSGVWYELSEMTGRDFLAVVALKRKGKLVDEEDIAKLLGIVERRAVACSEADPLDRPIEELVDVLKRWVANRQANAVPPPIATS